MLKDLLQWWILLSEAKDFKCIKWDVLIVLFNLLGSYKPCNCEKVRLEYQEVCWKKGEMSSALNDTKDPALHRVWPTERDNEVILATQHKLLHIVLMGIFLGRWHVIISFFYYDEVKIKKASMTIWLNFPNIHSLEYGIFITMYKYTVLCLPIYIKR
jgi:hypothetical protein